MAGIMFDGQMVIRPQARVRVDAQGLVPTVLGSANVIMAFGSALGGEPNKVMAFSEPQDAEAVFRGGNLLKAMNRMWNASLESPGASTILAVRIDPATKSTKNFQSATPADLLTIDSLDWGAHTTDIQVKVEAGSTSGKKITVQHTVDGIVEVFDNLASVAAAVAAINNPTTGSVLVKATLVLEGTLADIAFTSLAGGVDGTPATSDWDDGFELIEANPSDVYYVATADSTIQSHLVSKVTLVSNNKKGGICVLGTALGATKADVEALAEVYASSVGRVIVCTPGTKEAQDDGSVIAEASFITTAAKVAGLKVGLPVNRAMTYKTIAGYGLEKDYTSAELDQLEVNGVLAIENVPNRGLRVVHGQTTWTGDLNPLYREASVRTIGDVVSLSLRDELSLFVGEPGTQYTVAAIKGKVDDIMVVAKTNGLITDGVDDQGNPQPAWRNVRVKFNSASGICYVEVECSPVTPVNFILVTAHFRATNIVA